MTTQTSPAQLLLEQLDQAWRLFQNAKNSDTEHDAWLEKIREIAHLMREGVVPLESWSWLVINANSFDDNIRPHIIIQALRAIRTDVAFFKRYREENRLEITRTLISAMGREEADILRETGAALENQLVLFPLSEDDKRRLFPHFRRMLVEFFNPHNNQLKYRILLSLHDHFKE